MTTSTSRFTSILIGVSFGLAGCASKDSAQDGGGVGGGGGGGGGTTDGSTDASDAGTDAAPACPTSARVGFRTMTLAGGIRLAVWYPTTSAESSFDYGGDFRGMVAQGGVPGGCERVPLVVFSHGLAGCGTQSIFLTERLARAGYVVAAPDHRDAVCAVDAGPKREALPAQPSLLDTASWTDASYADRRDDIHQVIDGMLAHPDFAASIDPARIALVGHSLGGYTAAGIGGAWPSWKDARVQALLLLSPYVNAFITKTTLAGAKVPMMYQGADLDLGVTPFLEGPTGAFALSGPPKYFAKLRGGSHFEWTNLLCAGQATVDGCIAAQANAGLIVDYGLAFLDRHVKGASRPLLAGKGEGLSSYQHVEK